MPSPVIMPHVSWGSPHAAKRALLIHGLGSNGALMWLTGTFLADQGYLADAVDLRGHGLAPRALDYTIGAYGADLGAAQPESGEWDLVVAHSLGAAAAVSAAAANPQWAKRLVLVDPAIHLTGRNFNLIRASQQRSFVDPTLESVRAEHPAWHPIDQELKVQSVRQSSHWAIEQTLDQNEDAWDVRAEAARVTTPTVVIGADPAVYSIFRDELAAEVLQNPHFRMTVVPGAGHSPHRDQPAEYLKHLAAAIA